MRKTLWIALAAATLGLSACMPTAPAAPAMPEVPMPDAMAPMVEEVVAPIVCNNGVCGPAA